MEEKTIYQEHGFDSRRDYLINLAERYEVDVTVVANLASVLGKEEDFDGLVTSLQDIEMNDEVGDFGW